MASGRFLGRAGTELRVPVGVRDLRAFQDALVGWFRRDGADHPWRRTTDPYAILVSEMMLQQTRVTTVLDRGYYDRWMRRFPDAATLAAASEAEVLRAWEGLGYYTRARNLLRAARTVVASHGGVFPRTVAALEALPGIGRYTAAAVASFAFNQPVPLVDGNVARVLARVAEFRGEVDKPAGHRFLWGLAATLVPARRARHFNSALMELGQRVCVPRAPRCGACPVARWCRAKDHRPDLLPARSPRRATVEVDEHAILAVGKRGVLLHRESGRRRHGLWKLPARDRREVAGRPVLLDTRYTITHHKVRLRVYAQKATPAPRPGEEWIALADLPALPMPAPYRRAVRELLRG